MMLMICLKRLGLLVCSFHANVKCRFRKWFRSLLVEQGGSFSDVFRSKHPERKDAYTCWPSSSGAEQFNYGSRIDHILVAGSCLHQDGDDQGHSFFACHVKECEILTEYKRMKDGNVPTRWKGGLGMKLKGSDHIPVFTSFDDLPEIPEHSTPSLASRYLPMSYGVQQTLVSVFKKRQAIEVSCSSSRQSNDTASYGEISTKPLKNCSSMVISPEESCSVTEVDMASRSSTDSPSDGNRKKARKTSQLSLRSFFTTNSKLANGENPSVSYISTHHSSQVDTISEPSSKEDSEQSSSRTELNPPTQEQDPKQKNNTALMEWQRIQNLMQNTIPLCKGHKEACVTRVVKKPGPTFGRRFYVCSRAEGPSSNPEANCGYFKWASSKFRDK